MKVYDAQSLRNVALVGHSGAGKTQLVSTLLFDAGAVNRLRTRGRRHHGDRLRRRRNLPQAHPLRRARLRRVEQDQNQLHRHAGHGELPQRRARRAARRRCRPRRRRRGRRRRGLDREGLGRRRGAARCRASSCSTASTASAPASSARSSRCAACSAARSSRSSCRSARRRSFRGVVDLVAMKAWTFATDGSGKATEGAVPAELESAAAGGARRADRDGRRGRRRADGEVLRRRAR